MYPSYLELIKSGEIDKRIEELYRLASPCKLCPRRCKAKRKEGNVGFCGASLEAKVSSYDLHFGEEPPISGYRGSGTIFFTGCNMGCVFCQNYTISHYRHGSDVTVEKLANMMLYLQRSGAHNINLVTPTPHLPAIVEAVKLAGERGLRIPIVYNTGGYELPEVLELLEGIVDIYMPDMKYGNSEMAKKYSKAPRYVEFCKESLKVMHKQVGVLELDRDGVARRGLLVRHLVLPNGIAGTREVFRFIAEEVSRDTFISLLSQYYPAYRAYEFKELSRRITREEFEEAKALLQEFGLRNAYIQDRFY